MRCSHCGWIVKTEVCPCGATAVSGAAALVPLGTRVLARAGKGPSMRRWERGEVQAHVGPIHRVEVGFGVYWCEADDLLPLAPDRPEPLVPGARVWGLWLDGGWYPGTIDGVQDHLRKVSWDDGDSMWTEAWKLVVMAVPAPPPMTGSAVLAPRPEGGMRPATVEEEDEEKVRVVFADGEEAWVPASGVKTYPPCPFLDLP